MTAIQTAKARLAAKRGETSQRFQESTINEENYRVDAEEGVIRGVKVLGSESRNNRSYTEKALNSAASLYEGVDVFFDHRNPNQTSDRGFAEGFGTLKGCKVNTEKGGVFADLHYLKSHPLHEMVLERIERGMRFGLSHDAEGRISPSDGGGIVVDDLERVHSVDIVLNPATNAGLFESLQTEEKTVKRKVIAVLESAKREDERASRLLEMMDAMDYPVDEMEMEVAGDEPAANVDAAAASLVVEVIKDPAIDPAETKKKVNKILDAFAPEAEPVTEEEGEEEEAPVSEMEGDEKSKEEKEMAESVKLIRDELKALREAVDKQEKKQAERHRPVGVRGLRESINERPSGTLRDYLAKSSR